MRREEGRTTRTERETGREREYDREREEREGRWRANLTSESVHIGVHAALEHVEEGIAHGVAL